jgi:hypothetical protein
MQVCKTKNRHFVNTLNDYKYLDVQIHAKALQYNQRTLKFLYINKYVPMRKIENLNIWK